MKHEEYAARVRKMNPIDDKKFPATSGRKRYFKEDEKGVAQMCAIMQEVKEEGREEGRIKAVIEMYLEKDISLETACKRLGLTEETFLGAVEESQSIEEQ